MKKYVRYITLFFVVVFAVAITINYKLSEEGNSIFKPEIQHDKGPEGKNAPWSEEDAQRFYEQLNILSQNKGKKSKSDRKRSSGSYADGNLFGFWESKGPFNMPGAWQFCEMDEGTDTIYAVTCGHYGGTQFIWKGTLTDDKWQMINPKHPARFEDVLVLPFNGGRRVIAGKQGGGIMFSDNAGTDWTNASGLPIVIHSTIVNRQDNNVIYASGTNGVYRSTDNGASFQLFQSFTNSNTTRMYSPRWSAQPGANEVYLARDKKFYKLNASKTSFTEISTVSSTVNVNRIAISGDNRRIWLVYNERHWHSSTNQGVSFAFMPTTNYWYSTAEPNMSGGQFIGVNPEDPDIFVGGYSVPLIAKNAGATTIFDANKYWGYYQNAVGNDQKVRENYHPDFQSSQFFYDKEGRLMTLRSSDGGMFISYNEWTKNGFPTYNDIVGVYYNISLFDKPSQETYRGGFIYGHLNPDHLTAGTQDQGWQNTRPSTYGQGVLSWDQIQGGDGPSCITGDGKIGWSYNYFGTGEFRRFPLYNTNNAYVGLQGQKTGPVDFTFANGSSYFTPSVGDWDNGDRIWVLSRSLRRITHQNGTITAKEDLFGTGNSFIQGLAQSKVNPNILYTMRNGIVYKSTNRGDTWSEVANANATGITGFQNNHGMAWSSPLDQNIVLFATQSGTNVRAVLSTNGGTTWENVTGTGANQLPNAEVNGMAGSKNGKYVFASTSMGPYVFAMDTKMWYPLATDAHVPLFWGQIVYCVDYGDKEVVHFSTWGQGVWSFTIEDNPMNHNVALNTLNITSEPICENPIDARVQIRNLGNQTLTSVVVKIYFNDVLENSFTHETNLLKGAAEEINLFGLEITSGVELKVVLELPNGNTDEDHSNNELSTTINLGDILNQGMISVVSFSTEETSGEGDNNGRAIHAIDGDPATFWHARWTGAGSSMPHELVFNLGQKKQISKVGWLQRQNNTNGNTKTAAIYISEDGVNWGDQEVINVENTTANQRINITPKVGRYVKVVILTNHANTNTSSLAEINFYGCDDSGLVTSLESINAKSLISIYPNPVMDHVMIEGENIQSVELLDLSGKLLETHKVSGNSANLNMSKLNRASYLLKITTATEVITHKIVKN